MYLKWVTGRLEWDRHIIYSRKPKCVNILLDWLVQIVHQFPIRCQEKIYSFCRLYGRKMSTQGSPVHVVLVSLLVDQLSGLFLTFFGWPKKNLFSLREFLVSLWIFFGQALIFWYTKKKFWYTKKKLGGPKKSEPDQKFSETEQIFFGRPKKRRNRLDNWSTKRLTKTTWTGPTCSYLNHLVNVVYERPLDRYLA